MLATGYLALAQQIRSGSGDMVQNPSIGDANKIKDLRKVGVSREGLKGFDKTIAPFAIRSRQNYSHHAALRFTLFRRDRLGVNIHHDLSNWSGAKALEWS